MTTQARDHTRSHATSSSGDSSAPNSDAEPLLLLLLFLEPGKPRSQKFSCRSVLRHKTLLDGAAGLDGDPVEAKVNTGGVVREFHPGKTGRHASHTRGSIPLHAWPGSTSTPLGLQGQALLTACLPAGRFSSTLSHGQSRAVQSLASPSTHTQTPHMYVSHIYIRTNKGPAAHTL